MRVPVQAIPVQRHLRFLSGLPALNAVGVMLSEKKFITGKMTCKRRGNLLFTASETVCADHHQGCTDAKVAAVNAHAATCRAQGGIPQQSTDTCTYGEKCRN